MKLKLFTSYNSKPNETDAQEIDLTCFDLETFVSLFNKNQDIGLSYLQNEYETEDNISAMGSTLFEHKDKLNDLQLGKCLTAPANIQLLQVFISAIDMRYVSFVDALQKVLTSFKFDGEAQIIEKITGLFAQKYYLDNRDRNGFDFNSSDACEILAFACVMLNTDLHTSHSNHKRMTKNEFIKNLRGQNLLANGNNSDFDSDFLLSIYKHINDYEIKLADHQSYGILKMPKFSLKPLKKMF